jgi:group I intron endonuclease
MHINGYSKSPLLANAIKKYGKDSFRVEILEDNVPEELLSKLEILNIRFFNSIVPNRYNLTIGGEGKRGYRPSKETRRKLSEAQKGKPAYNKGKSPSPETREKMSKAMMGRPSHNKGKSPSPDVRRRMSESSKGKRHPPKHAEKYRKAVGGDTTNLHRCNLISFLNCERDVRNQIDCAASHSPQPIWFLKLVVLDQPMQTAIRRPDPHPYALFLL